MAGEWGSVHLGDVAEIVMGQSPPGYTYNEAGDGLPFFQGTADFGHRYPTPRVFCTKPSRIARPGDILLSVRAPIGKVNVADRECAIGRGLAIIRPKQKSDVRYIEYVLRYLEPSWHAVEGSGSVFGNATKRDLEQLVLPWPEDRSKRIAIAHILGTLDDKIELNRHMNENLEAMARAIFKAWFVDFEPVRAKMEGRWQRGQSLPGLPAHLYDLFPDRLVPSELGEIPEGWQVGNFSDVITLQRNQVNPLDSPEEIFLHFSIPAFDEGRQPKIEKGREIKSHKYSVPPGAVLLSKLNPEIERIWLVDVSLTTRSVCSTEFLVLLPKPPFSRPYVYCLAGSERFREELRSLVTGTSKSHQRVRPAAVLKIPVVLPPRGPVEAFQRVIEPLFQQYLASHRESHTLAALRNALLPKLISGEIRVKDAERFLEEKGL